MKTLFKLTSIILATALLTASSDTFARKFPGPPGGNNYGDITYVVKVTNPTEVALCDTYVVVIKDEKGNPVGPSIIYREGISTYIFHENVSVLGTRIAYLEKMNGSVKVMCQHVLYANPDAITGKFRSGSVYIFNLAPAIVSAYVY